MIERIRATRRDSGRSTQRPLTILDAVNDPALFKPFFKNPKSWAAWFAILAAIFCSPMTDEQLRIFQQVTGRTEAPTKVVKEVWLAIGRRGGKSRILALIATWLACFHDYRAFLSRGENGVVQVLASDRRQAKVILRYVRAFIANVPMLARLIESETTESISLRNGIIIEVVTASFRSVRGFTLVAALCDEIAFWPQDDSASPDTEILAALRPAMATVPNAMLLCASSPYAKRGALYDAYKAHYGKNGDPVLVVQADTATMNPVVDRKIIADAYEADPVSAASEYGALFRTDVQSFVSPEAVRACVQDGVFERPYDPANSYVAFCDPSGGSGTDSMTLTIAHHNVARSTVILDVIREARPPFSPETVTEEFCKLLKEYRVNRVIGDRFGGGWPREVFSKLGIVYEASAAPKSNLYIDALALINSGRIELLDHKRLISQLIGLERKVARSGKDSVDHAPGQHDDLANACAGVASIANAFAAFDCTMDWVNGTDDPDDVAAAAREQRRDKIRKIMAGADVEGEQAHPTLSNADLARYARPPGLGLPR